MLGKYCRVCVSRPIGSVDTAYGFVYPVNFGYATGKRIQLPEHTGAYILGIHHPVREFEGRIIAVLTNHQTNEKTLVVCPKSKRFIVHEIDKQLAVLKEHYDFSLDCLYERSCGAVVYHEIGGKVRYLLIKNKRSAHWSFPKGHVEKGESDEQAAIREVKEETGIDISIIEGFKAKSEYSIQHKIEKMVYIYAATCQTPKTVIQEEEIEDYLWLDFHKAMRHLKFENDKNILYRVNEFLKKNEYI
ncbi:MAG: NUDIX domain-containing protein [Clostridia bacterium]|nr:NUDIX domain-containing protein [Clostridia bacterium]